jgi:lauroyl/myristoyl acyltransferase
LAGTRAGADPLAALYGVARLVEAQLHAAPADWLWSHKR